MKKKTIDLSFLLQILAPFVLWFNILTFPYENQSLNHIVFMIAGAGLVSVLVQSINGKRVLEE